MHDVCTYYLNCTAVHLLYLATAVVLMKHVCVHMYTKFGIQIMCKTAVHGVDLLSHWQHLIAVKAV
jgi:hypothetical protein